MMVHRSALVALAWSMSALRQAHSASLPTVPGSSHNPQVNLESLRSFVPSAADRPTVIDLGYAKYQSDIIYDENVLSFLGIRYAAPPVGKGVHNAEHLKHDTDRIDRRLEVAVATAARAGRGCGKRDYSASAVHASARSCRLPRHEHYEPISEARHSKHCVCTAAYGSR